MIPSRTRFLVLERDGFACQYCGAKAPDVLLEVDHVVPRSSGGPDFAENLITSCLKCNSGKKDIGLRFVPDHILEVAGGAYERGMALADELHYMRNAERKIPSKPKDSPEHVVLAVSDPPEAMRLSINAALLTQAFVAGAMGISKSHLCMILNGSRSIQHKHIEPFCLITGHNLLKQVVEVVGLKDDEFDAIKGKTADTLAALVKQMREAA